MGWESGGFPALSLDVLLCEIIIITFLSLRGFPKWINNVTPRKPSTEAGFFPSFDIELKPASHRGGVGWVVMIVETSKIPPADS